MLPLAAYQILFLIVSVAAPLIFTLIQSIPINCKTAPHFASHIIFLALQICLILLSIWLHLTKWKLQKETATKSSLFLSSSSESTLLRSQGRCCRELITHMKLVDTYTNLCFVALIINSYFGINTISVLDDTSSSLSGGAGSDTDLLIPKTPIKI